MLIMFRALLGLISILIFHFQTEVRDAVDEPEFDVEVGLKNLCLGEIHHVLLFDVNRMLVLTANEYFFYEKNRHQVIKWGLIEDYLPFLKPELFPSAVLYNSLLVFNVSILLFVWFFL